MHYYDFNVGDYRRDTIGLSVIEDCAYRRIIDSYHLDERPFNGCSTDVARLIGMSEHAESVEYILRRFFREENGFWVHDRIEDTIKEYQRGQRNRSRAGKISGKRRRERSNTRSTDVQRSMNERATSEELTSNHKPRTKNQEPKRKEISRAARSTASRPAEIPEPLWLDYLAVRADRRAKTFTSTALAGIQREAALAGISLEAAMTECVERGWIGFKASWHNRDEYRPPHASMKKTNADLMRETVQRLSRKIYDEASPEDQAEFDEEMRQLQGGNLLCLPSAKI